MADMYNIVFVRVDPDTYEELSRETVFQFEDLGAPFAPPVGAVLAACSYTTKVVADLTEVGGEEYSIVLIRGNWQTEQEVERKTLGTYTNSPETPIGDRLRELKNHTSYHAELIDPEQ